MAERRVAGTLDVTRGTIWRQLITLCVPVFLASFFQQAYAFVDAWVVGQWAGKAALGGIQSTAALIDLAVGFAVGVSSGCAVICGQFFGAGDDRRLSTSVHTAMAISVVGGVAFTIAGLLLLEPLLSVMGTPPDLLPDAMSYGRAYFSGMFCSIVFNMGSAVLRAVGDTFTPSLLVALAGVVNILLDLLFVAKFGMGARGAGIATAVSIAVGAVAVVVHLMRLQGPCRLELRRVAIDQEIGLSMVSTGLPLGIQSSAYSISNVVMQATINSFGSEVVTAWGIAGRVDSIIWMGAEALGVAVTTFSAQNYGAGNMRRVKRGMWVSLLIAVVLVGLSSITVMLLTNPISHVFINDDSLASIATMINCRVAPFYVFFAIMNNISGTVRGTGESFWPMVITLVGTCALRIAWLVGVVPIRHTLEMTLFAFPLTWIATLVIFVLYYRSGSWERAAEARRQSDISM